MAQPSRVVNLPAAGCWETTWSIEIQDTALGVAGVLAEIVSLQAKPVFHKTPHVKFSATAT